MSASPAGGPPSGPSSTTPNATGSAPVRRRRPPTGPFRDKSKQQIRKPVPPTANGATGAGTSSASKTSTATAKNAPDPDDDPSTYTAFPLVATSKAELERLRFHAMRFAGKGEIGEINPWNPSQFTPPLRLHRRFARDTMNLPPPADGLDDKEREKEVIRRADRQAQKEADQALIAPSQKSDQTKKRQQVGQKKVVDVFYPKDTADAQKTAKLRYEEGRPWHLEDFDGKNTWIGSYEASLSETHVMLSLGGDGSFRMVPLEKWYKFTPTGRVKTMSLDEAEKHMAKKMKDSRWLSDAQQGITLKHRMDAERQKNQSRGRVGMRGERPQMKGEGDDDGERLDIADDIDEIDFEHDDEFQDDDEAEGKLYGEEDEEFKESKRKIRDEQLGANVFSGTGVKEEKDWDEEDEREKKEAREERRRQKKLKKSLVKQERKYEYESDSDHPYSEDSSEDDSETERQKEEERKKEEEAKTKANGDKAPSAASTSAHNTPSGRPEHHGDSRAHLASLKRPGSPNLSEASGSESNRKRIKKDANGAVSRSMSPSVHGARSPGGLRAGSGSDTEASGTERGKTKTKKNIASRLGSPTAGSPTGSAPGSRPGSPPPPGVPATFPGMPTADQVRAAIPPTGISIPELIKRFRSGIPKSKEANTAFIALVRRVGKNSPQDKSLIVLK